MSRPKKPKPQPANKPKPSQRFHLMKQDWDRIKWAMGKEGEIKIEQVLKRVIAGKCPTEMIALDVDADSCAKVAKACANHGFAVGYQFTMAASSFEHPPAEVEKPVDAETMAMVREELGGT